MGSGVRSIFKTLIKVPIIIFVIYFMFNIFAFSYTMFRVAALSQVVMQVAVENNYLPQRELDSLKRQLEDIVSVGYVSSGEIITNDPNNPVDDATIRRQYGGEVVVGVAVKYNFILPLMPNEQTKNIGDKFNGLNGRGFGGFADSATLENRRNDTKHRVENNIIIMYRVPGLKYYPDMN